MEGTLEEAEVWWLRLRSWIQLYLKLPLPLASSSHEQELKESIFFHPGNECQWVLPLVWLTDVNYSHRSSLGHRTLVSWWGSLSLEPTPPGPLWDGKLKRSFLASSWCPLSLGICLFWSQMHRKKGKGWSCVDVATPAWSQTLRAERWVCRPAQGSPDFHLLSCMMFRNPSLFGQSVERLSLVSMPEWMLACS